jgi:subtilisin
MLGDLSTTYINLKADHEALPRMYWTRVLSISALGIILLSLPSNYNAYSAPTMVDVLIGFNSEIDESLVSAEGGNVEQSFHFVNVTEAKVPASAIDDLANNPDIAFVEMDAQVSIAGHSASTDEYISSWSVDHIQADLVHGRNNKGSQIKVCILDTGMDRNHPDLSGRFAAGKDFVNGDNNPMDDHGHGTIVAGILAAILDEEGVVGVAPEASLYIGKVLNSGGGGLFSDVIAGIEWCVDNHVQIISMSFASSIDSPSVKSAVNAAYNSGALLVGAAGNSGNCAATGDTIRYPAKYSSVIAVGATFEDDTRTCISATGSTLELMAPGFQIMSTYPNNQYTMLNSGTSFATPHVAGAAALVWNSDETLWRSLGYTNGDGIWTNVEIRTVLDSTALDLYVDGRDKKSGFGLVSVDIAALHLVPSFPLFNGCTDRLKPDDPIAMNTVTGKKGTTPVAKTIHVEKESFNCLLLGDGSPVIVDVALFAEIFDNMATKSIMKKQAESVRCMKNIDGTVIGCSKSTPSQDSLAVSNCSKEFLSHPEEMNTVVSPTSKNIVKTIDAQKEVYQCDNDKKVEIVIFTQIWEDLNKLNGNPVVKKDVMSMRCTTAKTFALVESCVFSSVTLVVPP